MSRPTLAEWEAGRGYGYHPTRRDLMDIVRQDQHDAELWADKLERLYPTAGQRKEADDARTDISPEPRAADCD